jgi:MFS transporter, ACS family, tartrate transporter
MMRIMPYVFLLYIIAFLDRVNVSYAALAMKDDLGFSDEVLGLGAGIFFIGYFLLEIPGTILVENGARGDGLLE